jgi:5-methylcytosine-specific restriction endonuclease McrA
MAKEKVVSLDKHCNSVYQRIKRNKNCGDEWRSNRLGFHSWYKNMLEKQEGVCKYCGLPGDTLRYYGQRFRPNKRGGFNRGFYLEVDRKESKGKYEPKNCVLACYPCNNAKSDVFTYDEFRQIGEMVGRVKKKY